MERRPSNFNNMERDKKRTSQDVVLDYLHDLVFLLAILLVIFVLVFRIVVVSGPSMESTLTDGDYLIVLSSTFSGDPEPGDIVIVSKESFNDGEPIVKRVIATEGQHVEIHNDTGEVYVNGELLDEPYISSRYGYGSYSDISLTVDEGCVFVMGDNRGNSTDSRSQRIGQVDVREIVGEAIFLAFPGDSSGQRDFGRIGAP